MQVVETMATNYSYSTPVEALQSWAKSKPDQAAFIYLEMGEEETARLTFAELDRSARETAAYLQSLSNPGDRALLIYPTGLEFVKALYGCLYAGIVPIPTNPPGLNRSATRLYTIAQDAQAELALTTPELLQLFQAFSSQYPEIQSFNWVAQMQADHDLAWKAPDLSPERLAFIQYTSGSTNLPRGVTISYRNLSHNHNALLDGRKRQLEYGDDSLIFTWAPLFHDMGLIMGIFQSVYDGLTSVLMSPIAFMQKPVRWLRAITKYKATISGGPNFAFEVCVNKISPEDCQGLDLSSWRAAFNSAEPVRAETQDNFSEKFAPYGFKPEAFFPCYGLAEATLVVSGGGQAKKTATFPVHRKELEQGKIVECDPHDSKNCQPLVSCGSPMLGIQIEIVNPQTGLRCPPNEIGEIWIAGDSIAEGYWNRPEDTQAIFQARIKDRGEGPFLRTGDLGFIHAGELYITGRQKDLIIIRGRNYYPQDVEQTVLKSHPALQPGGGAAFSIKVANMEQLVVVQEVREKYKGEATWDEIIQKIRFDIAREFGIRAHSVILIGKGTIPKTSSGKIMRSECRNLFLNNELEAIADWRAPIS